MLKNTILASLLLAATAAASASQYYVVTPVKGKTVAAGAIAVSLSTGTLPAAQIGQAYAYNFGSHLQVTGDPSFSSYGVTWVVAQGTLPAGLTLDSKTGVVSGTPSAGGLTTFTLAASYKTKTGQQGYQLTVVQIQVTLADGVPSAGSVGQAYSYDLRPLLSVQGDSAYDQTKVQWTAGGALPAGLTLVAGVVSGTPSAAGSQAVSIAARYKGIESAKTYTFSMEASSGIRQFSGYRAWGDNTLADGCNAYRTGASGHAYAGATGDGVYRIKSGSAAAVDVYCDMTSDGGGWTLVRHVGANTGGWHPSTDKAAGTQAYGTYAANPRAAGAFSLAYAGMNYTEMRFASGDGVKWVRAPRSSAATITENCSGMVPVLGTHLRNSPHEVAWCLRSNPEDPWISAENHGAHGVPGVADNDDVSMVYGENSNALWATWRTTRGGANVFVR